MRRLRLLHTGVSCAIALTSLLATMAGSAVAANREVLPDAVTPTHYDLALSPDAEALTFRGTVAITVDVKSTYGRVLYSDDGADALVSHMASLSSADQ
jgi:predicted acyltransferase